MVIKHIQNKRMMFNKTDVLNISMIILFVIYISPAILIFNQALKTRKESILTLFYELPSKPQFVNFIQVFKESKLASSLLNSLMLAITTTVFSLAIISMAAYVIARNKSIISRKLYMLFVIAYFVPGEASTIPLIQLMKAYHLYGSLGGLILLYTSGAASTAIFLICAYIKSIPKEIDEAAIIDGAGMFRFFWRILFPLMKPIIVTIAILNSIGIYNDLMTPLIFLSGGRGRTVTLEILTFISEFSNNFPLAFSGIIISLIPILIIFFSAQKYIISGLTTGMVKG